MNCVITNSVRWMGGLFGTTPLGLAFVLVGVLASSAEAGDCMFFCQRLSNNCPLYNVGTQDTPTLAGCAALAAALVCDDDDPSGYQWIPASGETYSSVDPCGAVPTVSEWGLVGLALLLLTGIAIKFGRRGRVRTGA